MGGASAAVHSGLPATDAGTVGHIVADGIRGQFHGDSASMPHFTGTSIMQPLRTSGLAPMGALRTAPECTMTWLRSRQDASGKKIGAVTEVSFLRQNDGVGTSSSPVGRTLYLETAHPLPFRATLHLSREGGLMEHTGPVPDHDGDRPLARWQPWTALASFALLAHFAWEMGQMPLYRMNAPSRWHMIGLCTQAALGDVIMTLLAYVLTARLVRRRLWLVAPRRLDLATFIGIGVAMTVGLEWWNVSVRHSWSYTADMPSAAGIGLSPVVQWIVLPPLILRLARRHLQVGH